MSMYRIIISFFTCATYTGASLVFVFVVYEFHEFILYFMRPTHLMSNDWRTFIFLRKRKTLEWIILRCRWKFLIHISHKQSFVIWSGCLNKNLSVRTMWFFQNSISHDTQIKNMQTHVFVKKKYRHTYIRYSINYSPSWAPQRHRNPSVSDSLTHEYKPPRHR